MIKNEIVKTNGMEILEQDFNGDSIMTARLKSDGKIYVGVRWVCEGIGLSKGQNAKRKIKNI